MSGLEELRAELRKLPEDLATEAGDIVLAHAEMAKRDVQAGYPVRTSNMNPGPNRKTPWYPPGNLQRRITVQRNRSKVASAASVRVTAPHAAIFEFGTDKRTTEKGWNRGRMPKADEATAAIPKFMRARFRMVEALKEMVRRVSGAQVD